MTVLRTGGRPCESRDGHLELAGRRQHVPGAARTGGVTLSCPPSTPASPILVPTPRLGYEEPSALTKGTRKGTEFGKEVELQGSREESWLGVSGPAKELSHSRAVWTGDGTLGLSCQRKRREVAFSWELGSAFLLEG